MTNQKRGAAKLFHAARKKWDPAHGKDHVPGRHKKPPRDRDGEGSPSREARAERPSPKGKTQRPIRGAVGRRGRPGLHERPETNQRIVPEPPPPKRVKRERAGTKPGEPPEKPEPRPLPGAMPLNPCIAAFQALRSKALAYPNTYEDHAAGQTLIKLRNKNVVISLGREGGGLQLTCKLPKSGVSAVSKFSWAAATSQGLGRRNWVTAKFSPTDHLPLRMLLGWVEESHLAVTTPPPRAPKTGA